MRDKLAYIAIVALVIIFAGAAGAVSSYMLIEGHRYLHKHHPIPVGYDAAGDLIYEVAK